LYINISFIEVLEQMQTYARFMKGQLTKKRKFNNREIMELEVGCSANIQKSQPKKSRELSSFTFITTIMNLTIGKALLDLWDIIIMIIYYCCYIRMGIGSDIGTRTCQICIVHTYYHPAPNWKIEYYPYSYLYLIIARILINVRTCVDNNEDKFICHPIYN